MPEPVHPASTTARNTTADANDGLLPIAARQPEHAERPFARLDPHVVLTALEDIGLPCDGHLQALNSFENRVFLVGLDNGESRIAKFYRPGRWQREQLLEEHAFATELMMAEIPLAAPLPRQMLTASAEELQDWRDVLEGVIIDAEDDESTPDCCNSAFCIQNSVKDTLYESHGYFIAIYQRQGGRVPEMDNIRHGPAMRQRIGQFIARIHQVGARHAFSARPAIEGQANCSQSIGIVLDSGWLPEDLRAGWESVARQCTDLIEQHLHPAGIDFSWIRLHGDCHLGNLLWTEAHGPHFVDLDDCLGGPAVQDLWMIADAAGLQSGSADDALPGTIPVAMQELLDGYEQIRPFDRRELGLIESLRTLRMIRHSAWLAARWNDPAFPAAFPWFGTPQYWQGQILHLRDQLDRLQQQPLPQ
ncbi:MAG: serine/threonine protein kinase [Lautropia sp.]|nr:serine/threonine protein kinase [Lautropia sp.]